VGGRGKDDRKQNKLAPLGIGNKDQCMAMQLNGMWNRVEVPMQTYF
jgi:hypothetical protein